MKILCFGDSNTYGYDPRGFFGGRYPAESRWVDLAAKITGWTFQNAGENGREIPRRPGELQMAADLVKREDPDLLVVLLGGNDLFQGASPKTAEERMEAFLKGLPLAPEKILLVGPPAVARGAWVPADQLVTDSLELSRRYAAVAARLGTRFLDAGNWPVELTFDGVHFTEAGHRTFAESLCAALMG